VDRPKQETDLDHLNANTVRALAMDAVQGASSGHPGVPMGIAEAAYVVWRRFLRHIPGEPCWPNPASFIIRGPRAASVEG
jgi:transketolase